MTCNTVLLLADSQSGIAELVGTLAAAVLTALAAIIAASLPYLISIVPKHRLKGDLELLKAAKEAGISTAKIEPKIREELWRELLKVERRSLWSILRYSDMLPALLFGPLVGAGFAYWAYYLSRQGFSWWSLLPGFFAFACFSQVPISIGEMLSTLGERRKASLSKDKLLQELPSVLRETADRVHTFVHSRGPNSVHELADSLHAANALIVDLIYDLDEPLPSDRRH